MSTIGSLVTVNGGTLRDWPDFTAEIMGPGYSSHPSRLVAVYAPEGNVKVELVYDGEVKRFFIYRFRTHSATQHYWSRQAPVEWTLNSKKYGGMARACIKAYNDVFMR